MLSSESTILMYWPSSCAHVLYPCRLMSPSVINQAKHRCSSTLLILYRFQSITLRMMNEEWTFSGFSGFQVQVSFVVGEQKASRGVGCCYGRWVCWPVPSVQSSLPCHWRFFWNQVRWVEGGHWVRVVNEREGGEGGGSSGGEGSWKEATAAARRVAIAGGWPRADMIVH